MESVPEAVKAFCPDYTTKYMYWDPSIPPREYADIICGHENDDPWHLTYYGLTLTDPRELDLILKNTARTPEQIREAFLKDDEYYKAWLKVKITAGCGIGRITQYESKDALEVLNEKQRKQRAEFEELCRLNRSKK